jgi:hypothetical protein
VLLPLFLAFAAQDLSLLSEVFEELDDQTRLMEAECGVVVQTPPQSDMKTVNALIERVRRTALQIEVAREKGVRMIQSEAEEAKQIARYCVEHAGTAKQNDLYGGGRQLILRLFCSALGDNLERLKDDVAARKVENEKQMEAQKRALTELQAKYDALNQTKAARETELLAQISTLQSQFTELTGKVAANDTQRNAQAVNLEQKVVTLQSEVCTFLTARSEIAIADSQSFFFPLSVGSRVSVAPNRGRRTRARFGVPYNSSPHGYCLTSFLLHHTATQSCRIWRSDLRSSWLTPNLHCKQRRLKWPPNTSGLLTSTLLRCCPPPAYTFCLNDGTALRSWRRVWKS